MVDLGTETLGVYKELQRDMAATAVSELAPVNISLGGGAGSSRAPRADSGQWELPCFRSRASQTVELVPNPSLPTI